MKLTDLDTPVAVVDLDQLEQNITRAQQHFDQIGIANRPHIKTHKIPTIAQMQIEAGAVGITCQKLGEVEIMANAGIKDIFMPYNIVGDVKLQRLIQLLPKIKLSLTADSDFVIEGLSKAAQDAKSELAVFVEFDSGMGRCGVQTPEQAVQLARKISNSPGLKFGGLMTYPSSAEANQFVKETKSILSNLKIDVEVVSGGGTNAMWQAQHFDAFTEHRAGMYIFGDRYTLQGGGVSLEKIAFYVITTVVSRPTESRGILDGGSKTFSSDQPANIEGYGLILEYPDAKFYNQSEEHGFVDFSACTIKPSVGERVTVIPNHCCSVVNLFNALVGVRGGHVEVTWPVEARGAIQ